jgi:hypothetical protein
LYRYSAEGEERRRRRRRPVRVRLELSEEEKAEAEEEEEEEEECPRQTPPRLREGRPESFSCRGAFSFARRITEAAAEVEGMETR